MGAGVWGEVVGFEIWYRRDGFFPSPTFLPAFPADFRASKFKKLKNYCNLGGAAFVGMKLKKKTTHRETVHITSYPQSTHEHRIHQDFMISFIFTFPWAPQLPFGHLFSFFLSSRSPTSWRDCWFTLPILNECVLPLVYEVFFSRGLMYDMIRQQNIYCNFIFSTVRGEPFWIRMKTFSDWRATLQAWTFFFSISSLFTHTSEFHMSFSFFSHTPIT